MQPSTCLCMIVKNETSIIQRCLASARPAINCWSIVDTGSTDMTKGWISSLLADLPGTLHERPWVNFAHNRNEALELARPMADFSLLLDADEVLIDGPETWPKADGYQIRHRPIDMEFAFYRTSLIKNALPWRYEGVVHEAIQCPEAQNLVKLKNWTIEHHPDGARNQDPAKYQRDVDLLVAARQRDPRDTRTAFYLAQSYRDAGSLQSSLQAYEERVQMGGWDQEVFYSLLQVAYLKERLGYPPTDISLAYLRAFLYRPSRAEPLVNLARFHRLRQEYELGYRFAKMAIETPMTTDILFVDEGAFHWIGLDELALSAYYTGIMDDFRDATTALLEGGYLPARHRPRIEQNLTFA